jgi:hypothetical protein
MCVGIIDRYIDERIKYRQDVVDKLLEGDFPEKSVGHLLVIKELQIIKAYFENKSLMDEIMTANDVAEFKKVDRSSITTKADCGQIKGHKKGKIWLFFKDDIQDFLDAEKSETRGRPKKRDK